MEEIFVDVPNFEGFYQVSNLGRVKSLERTDWREGSIRTPHYVRRREKILSPQKDKMGYLHVRLAKNNIKKLWKVHQLVALVFLDHDRKDINFVVHHINEDKSDNRLINLQIQDRSEHIRLHHLK